MSGALQVTGLRGPARGHSTAPLAIVSTATFPQVVRDARRGYSVNSYRQVTCLVSPP